MRFHLGHGAGNDFVLLPDPGAALDVTPALARALCARRTGLGSDGVLRVVPAAAVAGHDGFGPAGDAAWAMDHRNADGSHAEMCGNGLRLFARHLVVEGLAEPGPGRVLTRAGVLQVDVPPEADADVTVDLGVVRDDPAADGTVVVLGDGSRRPGRAVSVGNPHLVVEVADLAALGEELAPPVLDPPDAFPAGVNVEHVVRTGPAVAAVRVHERGVGETQACGTGAGAVARACAQAWGLAAADGSYEVAVDLPGGRLVVSGGPPDATGGTPTRLTGPAVLLAAGELDDAWVAARA